MEGPTVHDRDFYIDGADCVIRVEDTLFKVHRFLLCRDSSTFNDMFNMPARVASVEGCSDENPVLLYGESVERFRTLVSVLYETPLQLQIYNTPAADVERLLMIAEVTNKYNFTSFEMWAVDALYHIVSALHGPPSAQYELGRCSSLWMKQLCEVALLCNHTILLTFVAKWWVDRIVIHDLRPVHALEIADRSGIRQLQGYAYYVQLLEMDDDFQPGVVEDGKWFSRFPNAPTAAGPNGTMNGDNLVVVASLSPGTPASITREQRERLLLGYWSLSRLWNTLRLNPPNMPQSEGCAIHQHVCVPSWTQAWKVLSRSEVTLKYLSGDVLGRLRAMERQLLNSRSMLELMETTTSDCRWGAVTALRTIIKEVQEGLADHFAPETRAPELQGVLSDAMECAS